MNDLLLNHSETPFISVEELNKNSVQFLVLDAREADEYQVSRIKDALFVGYKNFDPEAIMRSHPDKRTRIVVYCSIGVRSNIIAQKLIKLGYTEVFNLYGGIFQWKNTGNLVVDPSGNTTDRVHVYSEKWAAYLNKGIPVYGKN